MERTIRLILVFIGIAISFVVYSFTNQLGYDRYFLVPLIFVLYIIIDRGMYERTFNNVGYAIFFITAIFRYFLTPLIACISNYSSLYGVMPKNGDLGMAVNLIIYEEISIFVFFYCYLRKRFYGKFHTNIPANLTHITLLKNKGVYIFMMVLAAATIVLIPQSVANIHFIGAFDNIDLSETIRLDFPLAGLFTEIINLGRFFFVLLCIDFFYKKFQKGKISAKSAILLSIIFIGINASFVTNLSRFGIIIPIAAYTFVLSMIFSNQRKLIYSTMASCILLIVVAMSIVKFFDESRNQNDIEKSDMQFWGDTMNMYFMGVKETAVGVLAESNVDKIYGDYRYILFFNDIFSNVIGLSNFTISSINTVAIYNYVYFPHSQSVSQIPPNIVSGLYYFGKSFAPFYTLIFIFLFSFLDYKAKKETDVVSKFAMLYGATCSGLCMMVSGAMIISFLVNDTLMVFLYNKIAKKVL